MAQPLAALLDGRAGASGATVSHCAGIIHPRRVRDFTDINVGGTRAMLEAAAKAFQEALTAVEETLYQTKSKSRQDPLNFPIRLNDKLAGVMSNASRGDYAPTAQAEAVRQELTVQIDEQLSRLQKIWDEQLPALNRLAREAGIPAIR